MLVVILPYATRMPIIPIVATAALVPVVIVIRL
jgi:hypothetical protein